MGRQSPGSALIIWTVPANPAGRSIGPPLGAGYAETQSVSPLRAGPAWRVTAAIRDPYAITVASLRDAPTIASAARALAGELSERLGHQVDIEVQGDDSSLDTLREWSQGLLDCAERYPGTPLETVFTGQCEAHSYAESLVDTGVLIFDQNLLSAGARRAYLARLDNDITTRWRLPAAATPMGTAVHEFGHFVDLGLAVTGWQRPDAVEGHRDALRAEVGDVLAASLGHRPTPAEVGRALGGYALIRTAQGPNGTLRGQLNELVADAFTDVHLNGQHAQPANSRVVHRLDRAVLAPGERIASSTCHRLAQQAIKDRSVTVDALQELATSIEAASRARMAAARPAARPVTGHPQHPYQGPGSPVRPGL